MKRHFNNYEEFKNYYKYRQTEDGVVDVIERKNKNGNRVCADGIYDCESWEIAVKSFFKTLADDKRFSSWENIILESCKNNYFKSFDATTNKTESYTNNIVDFYWEVTKIGRSWSIVVKIYYKDENSNFRVMSITQATKEAMELYDENYFENGWTMEEWIEEYINALKEDGYKII